VKKQQKTLFDDNREDTTMSDIKGYQYVGKSYDENANQGLGAQIAHFVVVHKGREAEADSLANAFKAAKGTLRVRTGMVHWREDQVDEQISKLKALPQYADALSQLTRAKADLSGASAEASNQFAKNASRTPKAAAPVPTNRARPQGQGMRI
jgi:hypothetical protein